jgi:hypothetical protein
MDSWCNGLRGGRLLRCSSALTDIDQDKRITQKLITTFAGALFVLPECGIQVMRAAGMSRLWISAANFVMCSRISGSGDWSYCFSSSPYPWYHRVFELESLVRHEANGSCGCSVAAGEKGGLFRCLISISETDSNQESLLQRNSLCNLWLLLYDHNKSLWLCENPVTCWWMLLPVDSITCRLMSYNHAARISISFWYRKL